MKKKRMATLLLVMVMAVGMFSGCGAKFDASKYLQAQLDNSYKNDSSLIIEQKIDTKENAEKVYEQVLDNQVDGFFTGVDVSDEVKSRYRDIFADMLAKADYTLKEAEKQSDGSYKVSVDSKKMKIFEPVMEEVTKEAESLSTDDLNTYMNDFFDLMADSLEKELKDGVEYGDAENLTVRIEIVNKVYTMNESDVNALTTSLFDSEAISAQ